MFTNPYRSFGRLLLISGLNGKICLCQTESTFDIMTTENGKAITKLCISGQVDYGSILKFRTVQVCSVFACLMEF